MKSPAAARAMRVLSLSAALIGFVGCGGSGGGSSGAESVNPSGATESSSATGATVAVVTRPETKADSARFLGQASFGATRAEVDRVTSSTYEAWLGEQFAMPPAQTHLAFYDERYIANGNRSSADYLFHSFWKNALSGNDQLGQRVAYALSQIFVVSLVDGGVGQYPRGVAGYLDMLRLHAFGNYRDLLEAVALHPMMGLYLSHMRNQGQAGRLPDENFAREVMQLFSIGLHELEADGTVRRGADGRPLETYTNADVSGLAKVFTGWSWHGSDSTDEFFRGWATVKDKEVLPMKAYESYHASGPKAFLRTTCPGGTQAAQSLKCALDALFTHPNVGPFFGRQLIQRLVTSNPSPAYVARVAAAFANDGAGVRGDMKAVLRAILLDPDARIAPAATDARAAKTREPILRVSSVLRALEAKSTTGRFQIGNTDNTSYSLGQTPMRSPSVFNFYRPGYVPANSDLAAAGLVAPELQLTNETSVAAYLNALSSIVRNGYGSTPENQPDVKADYAYANAIAHDANALIDHLSLLLTGGQLSAPSRQRIRDVLNSITVSSWNGTEAAAARNRRSMVTAYLIAASPEFIVQK